MIRDSACRSTGHFRRLGKGPSSRELCGEEPRASATRCTCFPMRRPCESADCNRKESTSSKYRPANGRRSTWRASRARPFTAAMSWRRRMRSNHPCRHLVQLRILPDAARGLKHRQLVRVHLGANQATAQVLMGQRDGRAGRVGVRRPAMRNADRRRIRSAICAAATFAGRTIGGGTIIGPALASHRSPESLPGRRCLVCRAQMRTSGWRRISICAAKRLSMKPANRGSA